MYVTYRGWNHQTVGSPAQLSVKGLELQAQAYQPSADKSSVQIRTGL